MAALDTSMDYESCYTSDWRVNTLRQHLEAAKKKFNVVRRQQGTKERELKKLQKMAGKQARMIQQAGVKVKKLETDHSTLKSFLHQAHLQTCTLQETLTGLEEQHRRTMAALSSELDQFNSSYRPTGRDLPSASSLRTQLKELQETQAMLTTELEAWRRKTARIKPAEKEIFPQQGVRKEPQEKASDRAVQVANGNQMPDQAVMAELGPLYQRALEQKQQQQQRMREAAARGRQTCGAAKPHCSYMVQASAPLITLQT